MTNTPVFTAWLDDFFASYYHHRPVNATYIGVHAHDERLPDCSALGREAARTDAEALRTRLHALPDEPLTAAQQTDRALAEGFLEIQAWELGSPHAAHNPSLVVGEAAFGVISLLRRPFAPIAQRLAAATARINAIPALLAQSRAPQAPAAWVARALDECAGLGALLGAGVAALAQEHGAQADELRAAAARANAAVADFSAHLQRDVQGSADGYRCGAEAFDLLLRRGHFLTQGADEIERYAQAQFDEAEAYLAEHARDFGASEPGAALAQLADLHPPLDGYYARYGALWDACRAAAEQHALVTWPDYPLRYLPRPAWARAAAPHLYFLFYHAPAPFDRLPEVDYLVTPIEATMPPEEQQRLLRANNESVIKLNHVVHHGAVGHHIQNWHAARAESRVAQVAAVDCAARIALLCGGTLAEGWACYATDLMGEFGFLTPLEHYAERHTRLRMCARALVDVRLHHGNITLDEAAQFYAERAGMSAAAAQAEATKNSMFPATALMYLVGTDAIHDLRRTLAARPGFNLRDFHDTFLSFGSLPVALIAAAMRG